jgi:peptidoglycan hydrolase FlgJ
LPNSFPPSSLQAAIALKPSIASQAFNQLEGVSSSAFLNPLKPTLNPLHPVLNSLSEPQDHSDAELKKVSKDFEAVFMRMLFKEMRSSVEKSSLMGNSRAMEFFENLQDDQMSSKLASAGGLGIGNVVYQRLKATIVQHQKTFS